VAHPDPGGAPTADPTSSSFVVNGRTYVMPAAPVVVICIDGSEPDYHVAALEAGRMPWLRGVLDGEGVSWPAPCPR
jgi:phosphonoacetate hydrolase